MQSRQNQSSARVPHTAVNTHSAGQGNETIDGDNDVGDSGTNYEVEYADCCNEANTSTTEQSKKEIEELQHDRKKLMKSVEESSKLVKKLIEEKKKLIRDISNFKSPAAMMKDDDSQTRFYTGLPSFAIFNTLSDLFSGVITASLGCALSYKDQLLLVFMKLRLAIPNEDLGY